MVIRYVLESRYKIIIIIIMIRLVLESKYKIVIVIIIININQIGSRI